MELGIPQVDVDGSDGGADEETKDAVEEDDTLGTAVGEGGPEHEECGVDH